MNKRVLIAAGGSGGHLFPAQQLAELLLKKNATLLFAGYKLSETPFFAREKIPFLEIPASVLNLKFPYVFMKGFGKSFKALYSFNPDVVVGFGSYHVFPVLCAAAALRKKIVLFEPNTELGKVNRLFAPLAKATAVQFPLIKGSLVPFLPWVSHKENWNKEEARNYFQLDPEVWTFLVFGGSQGAEFLNETIPKALSQIPGKKQVIHFTGKDRDVPVRKAYADLNIRAYVAAFEPKMAAAYEASDCAICRSGAGTIAELIRHQMPALLIPFPKATEDHQRKNGEYLVHHYQAARLLLQKEANLARLALEIEQLVLEAKTKKLSLQKTDGQNIKRVDFADLVCNIGENS